MKSNCSSWNCFFQSLSTISQRRHRQVKFSFTSDNFKRSANDVAVQQYVVRQSDRSTKTAVEQVNTTSLTMTSSTQLYFTNNSMQILIKVSIIVIHFNWLSTNASMPTFRAALLYSVPGGGGVPLTLGSPGNPRKSPGIPTFECKQTAWNTSFINTTTIAMVANQLLLKWRKWRHSYQRRHSAPAEHTFAMHG